MREAVGANSDIELSRNLGYKSTGTVSNWRGAGLVPDGAIAKASQISGRPVAWFKSGDEGMQRQEIKTKPTVLPDEALPIRPIPVLGRVPAGFPDERTEEILEYISLPNVPAGAYALIVHGDSMAPAIRSGDYVIFVPGGDDVRNGDVVIVNNEWGESMCKRFREKDGEKLLVSDNPEYQAVQPNKNFRILGKVIKVWRNIEF